MVAAMFCTDQVFRRHDRRKQPSDYELRFLLFPENSDLYQEELESAWTIDSEPLTTRPKHRPTREDMHKRSDLCPQQRRTRSKSNRHLLRVIVSLFPVAWWQFCSTTISMDDGVSTIGLSLLLSSISKAPSHKLIRRCNLLRPPFWIPECFCRADKGGNQCWFCSTTLSIAPTPWWWFKKSEFVRHLNRLLRSQADRKLYNHYPDMFLWMPSYLIEFLDLLLYAWNNCLNYA